MTIRTLAVLMGMSCLLFADDEARQKVQVTHTERADFPSGGWLRFRNSSGELTVEGWDRPDIEIATIKSTTAEYSSRDREKASHELDKVRISVERQGNDLVSTTTSPRGWGLSPGFDMWYNVKVPMNAALAVRHRSGEVHVDNLTSDIQVTVCSGGVTLNLPQGGQYSIDARSGIGGVISDFPGHEKRRPWLFGHRFAQETSAAHRLHLRVGFGDITILKIQDLATPAPALSNDYQKP
jgi:hypothetical protein